MYCPLHFPIRQYLWVGEIYFNSRKYPHVSMQTLKILFFNSKHSDSSCKPWCWPCSHCPLTLSWENHLSLVVSWTFWLRAIRIIKSTVLKGCATWSLCYQGKTRPCAGRVLLVLLSISYPHWRSLALLCICPACLQGYRPYIHAWHGRSIWFICNNFACLNVLRAIPDPWVPSGRRKAGPSVLLQP